MNKKSQKQNSKNKNPTPKNHLVVDKMSKKPPITPQSNIFLKTIKLKKVL